MPLVVLLNVTQSTLSIPPPLHEHHAPLQALRCRLLEDWCMGLKQILSGEHLDEKRDEIVHAMIQEQCFRVTKQ